MAKRKPATPTADAPATPTTAYTVLARRYRPQQFADLIGQEHVAQALTNALTSGRVAHAYLFTGARGVGKTSTARILAKALNCAKGPTVTPCDTCDSCQGIMAGDDVDVVEIDGASNNSVDDIRELRQNVQFRPSRARFKIYIIDEVHMLSGGAFNALLKTLEEPPPHVKFMFATTNVQKIPITILSRCQRFDFAGISTRNIAQQLRQLVASEHMQADEDALELIARRAGGSMRDAESLLDQLLSFAGDKLTADKVHSLLGTAHEERVVALAGAVLAQQPQQVLQMLGTAADEGLDLGELLTQLIDYWRDLMVVNCAGTDGQALSVGSAQREELARQAAAMNLDTILAGLDILVGVKNRLRFSGSYTRVLIEAALLRLTQLGHLVSLSQLAQWLKNPTAAGIRGGEKPGTVSNAAPAAPRKLAATLPAEDAKKKPPGSAESNAVTVQRQLTAESVAQIWAEVLAQQTGLLQTDLQKIENVAISGPNTLVIRFPSGYNLLRDRCQERVGQLEQALQKLVGRPCTIRIETIETTSNGESMDNPKGLSAATGARRANIVGLAESSLMKKAKDVLGAQVVRADPGFGEAVGDNENQQLAPEPE